MRATPPATRDTVAGGFRDCVPLAIAVGAFGISYGVLARSAGMGLVAPMIMSLTTFGGSAQFAAVSVLSTGGGAAAAVIAAVLLNSRYLPIGLTIAPGMHGGRLRRFIEAQLVVDESWAIASNGDGSFGRARLIGAGLAIYLFWFVGTAIGVLGGDFLGSPEGLGLDAAFPALFLALLVPQVRNRTALGAALAGMAIALALVPFSRAGVPIIAASLGALLGWRGSGRAASPTVAAAPGPRS
ncbi:MAG: AzlC family ABC transporter permease [Dehalococcoidia bacterium]|nr:AzlC family ABC transporter permease [Dehalococcoidia bacterium]